MFDFRLFRVPTFTGAQIIAFTISAAMFAQFLFLTLYLAERARLLRRSRRACASCRSRCVSFVVAPIAGRLSARVPGALPARRRARARRRSRCCSCTACTLVVDVDDAARRLHRRRHRDRPRQRAARLDGGERRRRRSGPGWRRAINNTFRQVGIATGIAALGAIFQSRIVSLAARARRLAAAPCAAGQAQAEFVHGLQRHPPRREPCRRAFVGAVARASCSSRQTRLRRERPQRRRAAGAQATRVRLVAASRRRASCASSQRAAATRRRAGSRRRRCTIDERLRRDRERDRVGRVHAARDEDRRARAGLRRRARGRDRQRRRGGRGAEERERERERARASTARSRSRKTAVAAERPRDRDEEPARPHASLVQCVCAASQRPSRKRMTNGQRGDARQRRRRRPPRARPRRRRRRSRRASSTSRRPPRRPTRAASSAALSSSPRTIRLSADRAEPGLRAREALHDGDAHRVVEAAGQRDAADAGGAARERERAGGRALVRVRTAAASPTP